MNLNKIRPRNETEDLLLSITKKGETLFQKIYTRPEKHWNLKCLSQEKQFNSIHQF